MNSLPEKIRRKIENALRDGFSTRQVAWLFSVDKNTAQSIRESIFGVSRRNLSLRERYEKAWEWTRNNPQPYGFCKCGCGQKTLISESSSTGHIVHEHRDFVHCHFQALVRRVNPGWGQQMDAVRDRNIIRPQLVTAILGSNGEKCLDEIRIEVAPKYSLNAVSQMVNWARATSIYGPVPMILVRRPREKARPRYEQPEISEYERETEISLLVNRRAAVLLDGPSAFEKSNHEYLAGSDLDPLEMLLRKEDAESEEWRDRERRIREWEQWVARRNNDWNREFSMA